MKISPSSIILVDNGILGWVIRDKLGLVSSFVVLLSVSYESSVVKLDCKEDWRSSFFYLT